MSKHESPAGASATATKSDSRADDFLRSVSASKTSAKGREQLRKAGALLLEAVDEDPRCREAFEAIRDWLGRTPFPAPAQTDAFGVPRSASDFIAACYLRAQAQLGAAKPLSAKDVRGRLPEAVGSLEGLGQGFVEQLCAEIESRGQADPGFRQRLDDAARELQEMGSEFRQRKSAVQTRAPSQPRTCSVFGIMVNEDYCIIAGIVIGVVAIIGIVVT